MRPALALVLGLSLLATGCVTEESGGVLTPGDAGNQGGNGGGGQGGDGNGGGNANGGDTGGQVGNGGDVGGNAGGTGGNTGGQGGPGGDTGGNVVGPGGDVGGNVVGPGGTGGTGGEAPPPPDAGPGGAPVPDQGLPPACEVPAPAGCLALCADATGACPVDIYTFRRSLPDAVPARLEGVVTSVRFEPLNPALASHLTIQVPVSAPEYEGPVDSGLWVFLGDAPNPLPIADFRVGDRLQFRGEALNYFGQHQLHNVTEVQRLARDQELPAFTSARPADLATGGAFAQGLEGALVEIAGVSVTDVAPPPGEGDRAPTGEFVVDGSLRVDDFIFAPTFPALGAGYDRIAGVLRLGNGDTKLEPRGPEDVTESRPVLLSLLPGETEIDVGAVDAPRDAIGTPLTVTLDRAAPPGGFVVTLGSGNPALLRVPPTLVVPAGTRQAEVVVEGVAAAADVRLTASAGDRALDAHVAVVQRITQPRDLSITLLPPRVQAGNLVRMHLEMDEAPPGGFQYTLNVRPQGALVGAGPGLLPPGVTSVDLDFVVGALTPPGPVTLEIAQTGRPGFTRQAGFEVVPFVDYTGLVINELNYDNPDLDTFEFIEVYNGSPNALPLDTLRMELINGSDLMRYGQMNLADAAQFLRPGEFLVIGTQTVLDVLPFGTPSILLQGAIQNGPDGVRILDVSNPNALPVDAVAAEGLVAGAGEGAFAIPDGNGAVDTSLCRCGDGADLNDNALDFTARTPTPGAPNACL